MAMAPEHFDQRARQAADRLLQAADVEPPHFHAAVSLARLGWAVVGALGVAALLVVTGGAFALSSFSGPGALVWLATALVVALLVATSVVSAHAGGHAWFVPLPAAVLAFVWLLSVLGPHRQAGTWWLMAASAALSGMAVVMAAGLLRARAAANAYPVPTLVGAQGVVVSALSPVGIARVQGETWTAESVSGPLPEGAVVHVVRAEGLRLVVWSDEGQVPGLPAVEAPEG